MPERAIDPLNTRTLLTGKGKSTYHAIAHRLRGLGILIGAHIAVDDTIRVPQILPKLDLQDGVLPATRAKPEKFSSLIAHQSTLEGIDFIAVDPKALMQAYSLARNAEGEVALLSMEDDPDHWALKTSFAATFGTGYREAFQPTQFANVADLAVPEEPNKTRYTSMRFGTPMKFTALHCAVHESTGKCNVHIDQSGFVLALPKGWSVTANLYDHIANELKWKTDIQKWLLGKVSNETARGVIKEVIRRVSFVFPNLQNEFAGLNRRLHNIRRPETPWGLLTTVGRTIAPIGVTVDVYEHDKFKVQVHGTIANGDSSITVTLGGDW